MACREHVCTRCNWASFDNTGGPSYCPKCGAPVQHFFDEPKDYDEPRFRDEPDDEDDVDEEEEEDEE